jgi:hypothetical protein
MHASPRWPPPSRRWRADTELPTSGRLALGQQQRQRLGVDLQRDVQIDIVLGLNSNGKSPVSKNAMCEPYETIQTPVRDTLRAGAARVGARYLLRKEHTFEDLPPLPRRGAQPPTAGLASSPRQVRHRQPR